ncbi:MAG: c-type cytochrome [Deltaproteobacteria bacterium]|nr:c-type cytochrome [Deltaproteobacteria bacterium]
MAGARVVNDDLEKKSYSAIFLLAVGLLLAGAVWAVWDDNITRRPWKRYQTEFSLLEIRRAREALQKESERLAAEPAYQEITKQLAAARESLHRGESARRLAALQQERAGVQVPYDETEFELRLVKSKLEEAWYELEHAILTQRPTEAYRAHIEELNREKAGIEERLAKRQQQLDQADKEIAELNSAPQALEEKLSEMEAEKQRLERKLEGVALRVGPLELPKIPKIQQVVLEEFDRSNFNNPLARVDRCTSCHAGIEKAGFDGDPNPFKTHPHRNILLAKHPVERFGCTPCHGGQGAAVNSVEKAHGEVKFWEPELRHGDKVQASCIKCHIDVQVAGAEIIAHAEDLFVQLGCHGCHLVEGYDGLDKVGPFLRRIAAKAQPSWLVRWVENPHLFRAKTKMPNFLFSRDQATAVAAYVLDASKADSEQWLSSRPLPPGVDPNDPQRVAAGKELADSLGCRGCHGLADGESPALVGDNKDIAPNLSRIAEKTDARWLYHWLKNPRAYSPTSRMPNLRLSDEEVSALVSFLLTLGRQQAEAELEAKLQRPEVIAEGKALVRKYGCFGCHDIPGMENESRIGVELSTFGSKPKEELFFGNHTDIPNTWDDWTYHKLKDPRTYQTDRIEQVMPQFDLTDKDIKALRVFLASRTEDKVPVKYRAPNLNRATALVQGRRVVEKYNCVGCHVIEERGGAIRAHYEASPTLAPPVLNGEGAKVQSEWLFGFLKRPVPIRPWLKVRMPTFGLSDEEAQTLVQYFLAQEAQDNPFVYVDQTAIAPLDLEAGQQLASVDYFNCFSCHQQGDKKPEGPPEGWAPDLGMARERLHPEWIIRWLQDPQKVQPGTKMPSFYPGGPEDIFGGNEEQQIRALRDYLMVLGKQNTLLAADGVSPQPVN